MSYGKDEIRKICIAENIKIGALHDVIIADFISRYRSGERCLVVAATIAGQKNKKAIVLKYIKENPGCMISEIPIKGAHAIVSELMLERKIHVSGYRHTPKRTAKEFSIGNKENCPAPSYDFQEIDRREAKK
jgi:hypothetical protein